MRSRRSASSSIDACSACRRSAVKLSSAARTAGIFAEGSRQCQQVARIRRLQRDAAQQSLQIENAVERAAQLFARDGVLRPALRRHRGAALISAELDRRPQHPGAQQPLAHGRDRAVEGAEQRDAVAGAGKQRFDQLQVAHGDGVQHQAVLPLVEADAVHMVERAALGGRAHSAESPPRPMAAGGFPPARSPPATARQNGFPPAGWRSRERKPSRPAASPPSRSPAPARDGTLAACTPSRAASSNSGADDRV